MTDDIINRNNNDFLLFSNNELEVRLLLLARVEANVGSVVGKPQFLSTKIFYCSSSTALISYFLLVE
mgnify:CR=1 FL=1